jgi:hypothetical protein
MMYAMFILSKCFLFFFPLPFNEELLLFVLDSSLCFLSKPDFDDIKEELGDPSNV